MNLRLRLAVRDWDYLVPLALGDVRAEGLDLHIDRVEALPVDLASDPHYDAAELSLSRYCQGRAQGRDDIVGVPHFLMRGFRLRCILTRRDSHLVELPQLAGARIGLTGWQDSGNTWTRAVLRRRGGIGIDDALWRVGRLTAEHPILDRLGGYGRPGRIEPMPAEQPLLDGLRTGALDAVFTPFMPDDFFGPDSDLRPMLPNCRQDEVDDFRTVGYVPGIHILGFKSTLLRDHPWVAQSLSTALDASTALWQKKRRKYADTTPWISEEWRRVAHDLPTHWNANGLPANRRMIEDFASELYVQQLTSRRLTPEEIFPSAPWA